MRLSALWMVFRRVPITWLVVSFDIRLSFLSTLFCGQSFVRF